MNNELWVAIWQLVQLLNQSEGATENEIQSFFENNPVSFRVLDFDAAISYEKSSGNRLPYDKEAKTQREPDFICIERAKRIVTVFELKTPTRDRAITSRPDGQRAKLRAGLESYMSQTSEYIGFIESDREVREELSRKFGIESIMQVRGVLAYGMAKEEEIHIVSKLVSSRNPRIDIVHFDEILSNLIVAYSTGRSDIIVPDANGDFEKLQGLSFVYHLVLSSRQVSNRAYLCDLGDIRRNRVSMFVEDGSLVVELLDSRGKLYQAECRPSFNVPLYIRLELSNDEERGFVSVFINNTGIDLRLRSQGVDVRPDFSNFTLGSDLCGNNRGRFKGLETYLVDRTMNIFERIWSYKYYLDKMQKKGALCLEFDGSKYMKRGPGGHLYQPEASLRPILRNLLTLEES